MLRDLLPTDQPKRDREAAQRAQDYESQEQRLRETVAGIAHQVLVLSGKGGVGKSTIAANLAWGLAARDLRTGLLDADLNGPSIPLMMGTSCPSASCLRTETRRPSGAAPCGAE
jgi:Mrp family chromosome partitioning ATPase